MTHCQLSIEYEGMVKRRELYAKYGIAAEAAQLFETELGTILLALRALEEGWHSMPNPAAAQELLTTIDKSTLGRMLNKVRENFKVNAELDQILQSRVEARNKLSHGFFAKHNYRIQNEDGRAEMVEELGRLHLDVFAAWQAASAISSLLTERILGGHIKPE